MIVMVFLSSSDLSTPLVASTSRAGIWRHCFPAPACGRARARGSAWMAPGRSSRLKRGVGLRQIRYSRCRRGARGTRVPGKESEHGAGDRE